MGFNTNYEETKNILPKGEYEVIVTDAKLAETKGGTKYIDIPMAIRKDVGNPQNGGMIFYKIWKKKEPTAADKACDGYSSKQIQSLSQAAELPENKHFEDIDEWLTAIKGAYVCVTVTHEEYKGNPQARAAWVNPTKIKSTDFAEITDDDDADLPF